MASGRSILLPNTNTGTLTMVSSPRRAYRHSSNTNIINLLLTDSSQNCLVETDWDRVWSRSTCKMPQGACWIFYTNKTNLIWSLILHQVQTWILWVCRDLHSLQERRLHSQLAGSSSTLVELSAKEKKKRLSLQQCNKIVSSLLFFFFFFKYNRFKWSLLKIKFYTLLPLPIIIK